MPTPHQERQRILNELEATFQEYLLTEKLKEEIAQTCIYSYGLSEKIAREYAKIVYHRLQYKSKKEAEKSGSSKV